MFAPVPFDSPVIFGAEAVQLNAVPASAFGLLIVIFATFGEQIDCVAGDTATVGVGFTLIV